MAHRERAREVWQTRRAFAASLAIATALALVTPAGLARASGAPDLDGDGLPEGGATGLTELPPAPAAPAAITPRAPARPRLRDAGHPQSLTTALCAFPDTMPYPYCNSGLGGALGLRPALGVDPELLFFMTQTPGEDDLVWLTSCDAATEYARCCITSPTAVDFTVGAVAYNGFIDCNGTDTLFVSNVTTTAGRLFEVRTFPTPSPTSTRKCAGPDAGEDNLACASLATAPCANLREFTIPQIAGDDVDGLAVMAPPGMPPVLAIASRADARIYFADPTLPSCTAPVVTVVGSCQVFDGTTALRASDLAWAGGTTLLASDPFTDQLYEIAVDFATLSCTIVQQCASPGTAVQGFTYDRTRDLVFVGDAASGTIFYTDRSAGSCASLAVHFDSYAARRVPPLAGSRTAPSGSGGAGIEVEWRTSLEEDTTLFAVERALEPPGPFVRLTLVDARGAGTSYRVLDGEAGAGSLPYYRIVEYTSNGRGEETATFRAVEPAAPGVAIPRTTGARVRGAGR